MSDIVILPTTVKNVNSQHNVVFIPHNGSGNVQVIKLTPGESAKLPPIYWEVTSTERPDRSPVPIPHLPPPLHPTIINVGLETLIIKSENEEIILHTGGRLILNPTLYDINVHHK